MVLNSRDTAAFHLVQVQFSLLQILPCSIETLNFKRFCGRGYGGETEMAFGSQTSTHSMQPLQEKGNVAIMTTGLSSLEVSVG